MRIHIELQVAPDWAPLDPADHHRMMGGTERFALRLAELMAGRGHEVSLRGGGAAGRWRGVELIPETTVVGSVDLAIGVQRNLPPDVAPQRRIAWSHAAQWPREDVWDAVVAVSRYHAGLLEARLPNARVRWVPAGVDLPGDPRGERDRFLYASSPDRGLHRLLEVWPLLWERFGAPLSITYDLRGVLRRHGGRTDALGQRLRAIVPLLDQPGIVVHGPLDRPSLAHLRARSLALLYPHDPVIPHSELLSLSVLEACAASVPPVLAPVDCFPSEYGEVAYMVGGDQPDYKTSSWLAAVASVVERPHWRERARAFAADRSWARFADAWEDVLHEVHAAPAVSEPRDGQDWIVVAQGRTARGEAALARELVKAAVEVGHRVRVFTDTPANERVLQGPWPLERIDHGGLEPAIAAGCDRIVLSSSIGCHAILSRLGALAPGTPVVALEHTWPDYLPQLHGHEGIALVVNTLPLEVFEAGLQHELFTLDPETRTKHRCVGPLRPPVDAERGDLDVKRVFMYLGSGRPWVPSTASAILTALDRARSSTALELCYVSGNDSVEVPSWVERHLYLEPQRFHAAIEAADLVISHDGATTLGAALAAGSPVLAVSDGAALRGPAHSGGDRWCQAYFLAGRTELALGKLPSDVFHRRITELLVEPRPKPLGGGAARAVRLIQALPQKTVPAAARPIAPPELVP